MATLSLGGGGSSLAGALGNNAIGSALGLTTSVNSPLAFATKFGAGSIFQSSSLAYQIKARNNFDVTFSWFPRRSQIRTYFANAFTAADTDDLKFIIRSVKVPDFVNNAESKEPGHLVGAIPGNGINGNGELTIEFLSTEFSYVDHIIYQWMNETESPFWIYVDREKDTDVFQNSFKLASLTEHVPFTRADIAIQYYSSNDKPLHSVICYGAFPVQISTMDVDNDMNFVAGYSVQFAYDSMIVSSPFVDRNGSWASAASDAMGLNNLSNTAGWTSTIQDDMLANYLNKSLLKKASGFMNSITNKVGGKISGGLNKAQKAMGV